jgi:hypothetical protein
MLVIMLSTTHFRDQERRLFSTWLSLQTLVWMVAGYIVLMGSTLLYLILLASQVQPFCCYTNYLFVQWIRHCSKRVSTILHHYDRMHGITQWNSLWTEPTSYIKIWPTPESKPLNRCGPKSAHYMNYHVQGFRSSHIRFWTRDRWPSRKMVTRQTSLPVLPASFSLSCAQLTPLMVRSDDFFGIRYTFYNMIT